MIDNEMITPPGNAARGENIPSVSLHKGKQRIEFIDLAKGIAILLVVYLHCCSPSTQTPLDVSLKALRMPLYFTLSGVFFSTYGSFFNLIKKKTNKMIIPFVFFLIISYIIQWIIDYHGTGSVTLSFTDNFTLSRRWWNNPNWPNIALWFLVSLFWANCIFYFTTNSTKSLVRQCLCVFLIGFTGVLLGFWGKRLPLYIDSAFTALPYFFLGYLLRTTKLLYGAVSKKEIVILIICLFALFIVSNMSWSFIDFKRNMIMGNPLVALTLPIFAVTGILLLCKLIKRLPGISFIGRYSIVVLGFHYPVICILKSFWPIGEYSNIIVFLMTLALMPLAIQLCINKIPYFVAQKDLISINKLPVSESKSIQH